MADHSWIHTWVFTCGLSMKYDSIRGVPQRVCYWDFWWVCVNTKCTGSWQKEKCSNHKVVWQANSSAFHTCSLREMTPPGISEFQCLSFPMLHCVRRPGLKDLPGRGHCCASPTSHLCSSAESRHDIIQLCHHSRLQNGAYSILLHVLPNTHSCLCCTSRRTSGGGLPLP